MQSTNVVMLQSDPNVAQSLAASLANSFSGVHVARNMDELRNTASKHRPNAIILDLETASFEDVESLKQDFEGIPIICNHRVADEEMWSKTLTAGGDDCWASSDMRGIVFSTMRQLSLRRTVAA
jgi:DNA-binding response OmpR family regulator